MNKIKLKRLLALGIACFGISAFAFAGCNPKKGGNDDGPDTEIDGGEITDGGDDNQDDNNGGEKPSVPDAEKPNPDEPVIPSVPEENVQIISASGNLEAGYVTWKPVAGADWYNVYVQPEGGEFTKLDGELVRQYKEYYRADAVGLKAGKYTMKVVPTATDGAESQNLSATASFSVLAHERSGFGFVKGTSSGAYNDDGTLKSNANVIYITEQTKNTVKLTIKVDKADTECVGLTPILLGYKKQTETRPLCVRLIGNISDFAEMFDGDIVIDGITAGITFEGIGSDATCNGWGLRVKGSSNVEIRNLGFMNCDSGEGDNVGMQQDNNHVWVHNCDFFYGHAGSDKDQVKGDGMLDSKKTDYSTYSYNHFWDSGKTNLLGNSDSESVGEGGATHLTYHHNWYDHSDSRHPRIRIATVHVYNNYFDGIAKYGVGATKGASAFVENNYFRSTARIRPMLSANQGTDISSPNETGIIKSTFGKDDGGIIKSFNNTYDCPADKLALLVQSSTRNDDTGNGVDAWEAASRGEKVPATFKTVQGGTAYNNFDTADGMYEYTAQSPDEARQSVIKYAGRMDGGDFKWEFDNATEDANYAVIQPLKNALMAYKNDGLIKIGKVAVVSDGGNGGGSGGTTGGGTTGGGETLPADVTKVEFTSANKDKYPAGVKVNGNYNSKTGYLKMESSTVVTVTVESDTTLTVHTSAASKNININGEKVLTDVNGECKVTVKAGETVTIKKTDQMDLEYILFG